MAHRNRSFSQLETSIYGWDFPVRYVSHNQMVYVYLSGHIIMIHPEFFFGPFGMSAAFFHRDSRDSRGFQGFQKFQGSGAEHAELGRIFTNGNICKPNINICKWPIWLIWNPYDPWTLLSSIQKYSEVLWGSNCFSHSKSFSSFTRASLGFFITSTQQVEQGAWKRSSQIEVAPVALQTRKDMPQLYLTLW